MHNIRFLIRLTEQAKQAIREDRFGDFAEEFRQKYDWGKKVK